jgi:hypothetical protein
MLIPTTTLLMVTMPSSPQSPTHGLAVDVGVSVAVGVCEGGDVGVAVAVAGGVLVVVLDAVGVGEALPVGVVVAVAAAVVEPLQVPLLQRSLVVHCLPSSHGCPSLLGCLLMHSPLSGLHCPVEQASLHDLGSVRHSPVLGSHDASKQRLVGVGQVLIFGWQNPSSAHCALRRHFPS